MKRNSDHILIEWLLLGAQLGDRDALEQLALQMYPKLIRYAQRQLNEAEAAKDVVQNAFEVLSRDLTKIKDPAAFMAWIYQVVHRKCVDYIRQKQRDRRWQRIDSEFAESVPSTAEESPFIQFENLLSKLDTELYQVLHLHYLEGMNLAEISNILSLPEGTVKSRLFRARQFLKHCIGESHD